MINKLKQFISDMTDDEIDEQLKDIFGWAKIYQKLLEDERYYRFNTSAVFNTSESAYPNYNDSFNGDDRLLNNQEYIEFETETETEAETDTDTILDYYLIETIQEKVSCFSAEETKEKIKELNNLKTNGFSKKELAQLYFEIDCLELHYFELVGTVSEGKMICPNCGCEPELNAKFCGKCGVKIK